MRPSLRACLIACRGRFHRSAALSPASGSTWSATAALKAARPCLRINSARNACSGCLDESWTKASCNVSVLISVPSRSTTSGSPQRGFVRSSIALSVGLPVACRRSGSKAGWMPSIPIHRSRQKAHRSGRSFGIADIRPVLNLLYSLAMIPRSTKQRAPARRVAAARGRPCAGGPRPWWGFHTAHRFGEVLDRAGLRLGVEALGIAAHALSIGVSTNTSMYSSLATRLAPISRSAR